MIVLPEACSDRLDNDGDSLVDDDDPGCRDPEDLSETNRLDVEIDVRPRSPMNRVNPTSRGALPVAILGSETVDVTAVDRESLAFGPAGAAPLPWSFRQHDVNRDGLDDLVARFRLRSSGIEPGDEQACLLGEIDGLGFESCDEVRTAIRVR